MKKVIQVKAKTKWQKLWAKLYLRFLIEFIKFAVCFYRIEKQRWIFLNKRKSIIDKLKYKLMEKIERLIVELRHRVYKIYGF